MPHVRFNGTREERNGDWESVTDYADQPGAVGIVTELRPDLEAIDQATYEAELAAIKAHNSAIPAPAVEKTNKQLALEAIGAATTVTQLKAALLEYLG